MLNLGVGPVEAQTIKGLKQQDPKLEFEKKKMFIDVMLFKFALFFFHLCFAHILLL